MGKKRIETISTEDLAPPPGANTQAESGSIEQQLDMIEDGPLRGDEILRSHGVRERSNPHPTLTDDQMLSNYNIDMSEENREGAEETGDEHSGGLQGEEMQELQTDDRFGGSDAGIPGEMTEKVAKLDPTRRGYRRRAA